MYRFIPNTGWTKEEWIEFLKDCLTMAILIVSFSLIFFGLAMVTPGTA